MAKRGLFGKKVRSTVSEQSCPPAPQPLNTYHSSITTLQLRDFKKCLIDGNLSALVISGEPDYSLLRRAWSNILSEYSDAIGNAEYKLYVSTYRDVVELELKYESVRGGIALLRTGIYSKFVHETLNRDLQHKFTFNYKDEASYMAELDKAERRSKGIRVAIDLKTLQLDALEKKHKDGRKIDEKYFDAILISLSDHARFEITDSITVSVFCERLRRYNAYCEQLKTSKQWQPKK